MLNIGFYAALFVVGLVIATIALSIALVCVVHAYVKREEKRKNDSGSV